MASRLVSQQTLVILVVAALVLVIALAAVLAFGAILGAMGDESGSAVLRWIGAGVGVVFAVDLVCLILALAVHAVERFDEPSDQP